MATNSTAKAGLVRSPEPGLDIFRTPENTAFYSANLYQSLDKNKQEIRLIELSTQSDDDGLLECKLLPATFLTDARKQYVALSYCAGDPTDTKEIMVNGVRCNIFASLHHALVLARRYWIRSSGQGPLRLWVDQLCINQQDLKERSHQVGFMRAIYQGAEQTLACLSTPKLIGRGLKWLIDMCEAVPSREDDLVFQYEVEGEPDTGNSMNSERKSKKISNTTVPDRLEDNRCQPTRMHDYIRKNMHREKFVKEWIEFYDVLSSPWWNRAWICQEFLVSQKVSFMFGHHCISWERCWKIMQGFCELHRWFLTIQSPSSSSWFPTDCPGDSRILNIVEERGLTYQVDHVRNALRMKIYWSGNMDIKALLSHSRSCRSSDDRDRVYAMLGLAPPGYQIFPDYSRDMTAEDVMVMTTRAIIEKEDSLGVLVPATRLLQCRNLDVPSWVVDWTSTEALSVDFGNRQLYGGDSIAHESPQCIFETITDTNHQTRAHILWVYGIFITKIQWVTRKWPYAAFDSAQGRHGCHGRALISIKDGDELWFLYGSRVLMVLRSYLDGYQVISSAFLMRRSPMPTEQGRTNRSRIKLY